MTMCARTRLAHAAAGLALASALTLFPRDAEAQGATHGVIGVSVHVMPAVRPDTLPEARAPRWRSTLPASEPVLVRGAMVRAAAVTADERRRLVLAYVGN